MDPERTVPEEEAQAALEDLRGLDERPVHEHPALLEAVHRRLDEVLRTG